jgi:ankyrin repeat protein
VHHNGNIARKIKVRKVSSELIRLYTWLLGEKIAPLVDFATPANRLMVEETWEYIKEKQRQSFIREEARATYDNTHTNTAANLSSPAIKPSSSMTTEEESLIAATFKTAEDYDHVHNFLSFCNIFLQHKDSASLCALVLSYLVESESLFFPEKQAKVAALFTQFIELDEEQALNLYSKQNFANNFPETTIIVKKAIISELQHLDGLLLHETNLMGIIPLFYEKFFNINELAALILCLLKRDVPAWQLIQNRMLHDFLDYHLHALDSPDSAVKQLYAVLGQFSGADDLIKQASNRVAKLKSYYSGVSFWLNGERLEKEKPADAIIDTPFTFTITKDNFKNLHTLFGDRFLIGALALFAGNQDNALKELLVSCINKKENDSLSNFIETVAQIAKERNTAALLQSLATVINDKLIHEFLQARKGVIFHLVPYKPDILNELEEMDSQGLQDYINLVKSNDTYDSIGQLIVLLKQSTKKANVEELLYREILNFVIKNPSIQQEDVIDSLRNYAPKYRKIIQQQANGLVEELKLAIENNMLSKNDFSKNAYGLVEDTWRAGGFSLLKQLNNALDSDYPPDKYALYAYIVNSLVKKQIKFSLRDFLNNIIRSPNESAEGDVSEFERALIKILAAVDDPQVREAAIELLETTPRKNKQWIEKEYDGKSIFSLAARSGNLGLVQFFLTLSGLTNPEAVSIALIEAALNGQTEVVELLLLRYKANKAKCGNILLIPAASKGRAEVVTLLLRYKADVNTAANKDGNTPLIAAAANGHAEVVKLLLDKEGIDVNKANKYGRTPLIVAAANGHTKVVTLLLDKDGADNRADEDGNTPLIAAAANGHTGVVNLLLRHEVVKLWLLRYKADINKANKDGNTPLIAAAANGHADIVELLLAKEGINVNKASENGGTALIAAAANGHAGVVKLLLRHEVVKLWLLRYKADINKANKDGNTPLIAAAANGHADIVELLLKAGVEVNKANKNGNMPLALAVENRHVEVVTLLLTGKKLPEISSTSLPNLFELVKESPQAIAKAMTILNQISKKRPQNYSQLPPLKHAYNLQLFKSMLSDAAFAKENKALLNASSLKELQEIYGNDVHLKNLKTNIYNLLEQSPKNLHDNPALKLIKNYVYFLDDQRLSAALDVFNNNQSQVETATQIIELLEKDFTTAISVLNNHLPTSICDDDEEADKILRSISENILREVVSQIQKHVSHVSYAEQANITPQEKQLLARAEFILPILIKAKAEGVEELTKNILQLKAEGKLNYQFEGEKHSYYYKKAIELLNSLSLGQDGQDKIAQWNLRYKTVAQELDKLSVKQLSFWSGSTPQSSEKPHEIRIGNRRQP